ncbi:type-1 angiotensin II receptor-like [Epinephelus fuscoguttatus]|uniref:type-1 angiotensin II receptor-like n=1 Tax=Epinephelus fuscoguttatus TaxID=293821 RepID=UPI0020D0F92E|nr:type-1 angiotensin II receptor-like [Epinephelus fuscoguttatus]
MTADSSFNTSCSLNSSMNNCSSSETSPSSSLHPWYIVAGVLISVSCVLGIPANITVIVKLSQQLRGSTMSQRLFFNLAVSDLLCLFYLTAGVVIFFNGIHLTEGVCSLLFYFFFFCITSDSNILVLISIQRYYQILHHKKWSKLKRIWQRVSLFAVWMLGALVALPAVFLLREVEIEDEWTDGHSCKNKRIEPVLETFYISFMVFSQFVVLSFYLLLVRGVNRAQMPAKKQDKTNKLFMRIIAVSLVFGFSPLVLRTMYVAALFTESDRLLRVSKMLTFVECLYFFNPCLNPFLYFFASRHYRKEGGTKRRCLLMPLNDV